MICDAEKARGGGYVRCTLRYGHSSQHAFPEDHRADLLDAIAQASITIQRSVAELEQLGEPEPMEQRYCGMVAKATGVEVACERLARHDGPHKRGEMTWPNPEATALPPVVTPPPGPHSRACGIYAHSHGPACAADCPSCGWNPPGRLQIR